VSGLIEAKRKAWLRDMTHHAIFNAQTAASMAGGDIEELVLSALPEAAELLDGGS